MEKGVGGFDVLAKELGRKPLGVKQKLERMGVVVDKQQRKKSTTTTIADKDLLTHKQALKMLVRALEPLRKPSKN